MKHSVSALLLLLVMACGQITGNVVQEELTVAWIGPLTGDAANIGEPNLQGVQLAIERVNEQGGINGVPVRLVIQDDQWDEKQAISAYHKVTKTDDVSVVFGTTYGAGLALADTALADGVLFVNTLDTSHELAAASDGLVTIGIYDEGIGYAIADDIGANEKVAIISIIDPFAELVGGALRERLQTDDLLYVQYDPGEADFRTHLSKIQQYDPDVLVVLGWDELGNIFKQAEELGIDARRYTIDTIMSESAQRRGGESLEGVRFTFWEPEQNEVTTEFFKHYDELFGGEPTNLLFTAVGYDATLTVLTAMQEQTEKPLYQTLKELPAVNGVTGSISVDADGASRSIEEELFIYFEEGIIKAE